MSQHFGTKELIYCLTRLGFTKSSQSGSHAKYLLPIGRRAPDGVRPFMIVIMGKKNYVPPTCSSYMRQLQTLGFDLNDIVASLKK